MYKFLNTLPWDASWVPPCWPWVSWTRWWLGAPCCQVQAEIPVPLGHIWQGHASLAAALLCFSPTHYKSPSFSSPYFFSSWLLLSKVSVAPLLAFNPVDGHLPLQHYQSGVNSLAVPLTHPVTLAFLPCQLLLSQIFCQGWAMQVTLITMLCPPDDNFLEQPTWNRSVFS